MAKAKAKAKSKSKSKLKPKVKAVQKTKATPKVKGKIAKTKTKTKPAARTSAKTKAQTARKAAASTSTKPPLKRADPVGLTPLDDRILVRLDSLEKRTASGLYIPETAQMKGHLQGTVVAVGSGHRDQKGHFRPVELRVGDRILFEEWAGTEVQLGDQKLKVLRETEVLGLVD